MPNVAGKKFPYTKEGMAKAASYARKMGKKKTAKKSTKKRKKA